MNFNISVPIFQFIFSCLNVTFWIFNETEEYQFLGVHYFEMIWWAVFFVSKMYKYKSMLWGVDEVWCRKFDEIWSISEIQKIKMLAAIGFWMYPTILIILGCFGPKRCSKLISCGDSATNCGRPLKVKVCWNVLFIKCFIYVFLEMFYLFNSLSQPA